MESLKDHKKSNHRSKKKTKSEQDQKIVEAKTINKHLFEASAIF